MKRPRRRATGKAEPPRKRSTGEPFPKPRPRPKSVRPILGLPRNHADSPAPPPRVLASHAILLAAIGFFGVLGLTLAVRSVGEEVARQLPDRAAPPALMLGAIALGIGIQISSRQRRAERSDSTRARAIDDDAAAFTALAAAAGCLVGVVFVTERIRSTVTMRWNLPPAVLLTMSLAPLVVALVLSAALAAHVVRIASAWYHAIGLRVLGAITCAAIAGSIAPLGRQGVLVVAPLALFVTALIVLVRSPASRATVAVVHPLTRRAAPAALVLGATLLIVSIIRAAPLEGGVSSPLPLPEIVARCWEVRQCIPSGDALASCDLQEAATPTLLVLGAGDVADSDAPLLASRLARAARRCGRILFAQPCNDRLIRRVRRELGRGSDLPSTYLVRYHVDENPSSFIAMGFDIAAWVDARSLPAALHQTAELHEVPAPRGGG